MMTESDLQAMRNRVKGEPQRKTFVRVGSTILEVSPFRSKLEQAFAGYLHVLMLAGDIQRYAYEPIRLNLAPRTTLTPDFLVVEKDGNIAFYEVKGWAREDAMVKLKIAARLYPQWKFWLVNRFRGEWKMRELPV